MRPVVFIGPSLRATLVPEAIELRAPARRGDILAAVEAGVRLIALADGVFGSVLAVSPTEIRAAARLGARLLGGASMGAIRALECPDAMEGVGWVFEQFRSGRLSDDDEVALVFDTAGRSLSVPLVRVRYCLGPLVETGEVLAAKAADLLARIKQLPFEQRTLRALALATHEELGPRAGSLLLASCADPSSDVKARDAALLVARLRHYAS